MNVKYILLAGGECVDILKNSHNLLNLTDYLSQSLWVVIIAVIVIITQKIQLKCKIRIS